MKFRTDREQEFVIGGYRRGENDANFDALVVGYYDSAGALRYAGKVKNGFNLQTKRRIIGATRKLQIKTTPFSELPIGKGGRWGEGLTEEDLTRIVWLRPKLVAQVKFVEWTRNNMLRHPTFKGLRHDKPATEVRREAL